MNKHGDEGSDVNGVNVEDQFVVGVSTRNKVRSICGSHAAASLLSASVPTKPRSSKYLAVDVSQSASRAKSCEYPAESIIQGRTDELLFNAWRTMEETSRDFIVEDDQSSVDHMVVAPVMTHEAKTPEEELAEMKELLENLRKENEEKACQIALLTKRLEKRSGDEDADSSREDGDADSDAPKSKNKGGTFTAQQIQEMIANTLKMHFGEAAHDGHRYIKPYSKRVNRLQMPLGYQPPKFQQFDGKGNPKQHIAHFIETCNTAGTQGDLLIKQFVRSLKGLAFDWYTDLDCESIDNWDQLETEIPCKKGYKPLPDFCKEKLISRKEIDLGNGDSQKKKKGKVAMERK